MSDQLFRLWLAMIHIFPMKWNGSSGKQNYYFTTTAVGFWDILLDESRCFQSDGQCKTNISKIDFAALFKKEFEKSMSPATIEQKR